MTLNANSTNVFAYSKYEAGDMLYILEFSECLFPLAEFKSVSFTKVTSYLNVTEADNAKSLTKTSIYITMFRKYQRGKENPK